MLIWSKRQGDFFLKLFFAFMLFLLVPIVTVIIFFKFGIIENVIGQISKMNIQNISILQMDIENRILGYAGESSRFNYSKELHDLDSVDFSNYLEDGNAVYKIKNVVEMLSGLKASNGGIISVYYLNGDKGYILSSNGDFSSIDSFQGVDWFSTLDNFKTLSFLNTRVFEKEALANQFSSNSVQAVTVVCPIRQYEGNSREVIAINIEEAAIFHEIQQRGISIEGDIFILNRSGELVSGADKEMVHRALPDSFSLERILDAETDTGYFSSVMESQNFVVSFVKSKSTPWIYVNIQPTNVLHHKINQMWGMMWIVVLILIGLGVFLSYFLSRKIYKPVGTMMGIVKSRVCQVRQVEKNELKILSNVIDDMAKSETEYDQLIQNKTTDLKKLEFLRLVNGGYSPQMEITFLKPGEYFVCMAFAIDDYQEFKKNYDSEKQIEIKYLFLKACEESVKSFVTGFAVQQGNGHVVAVVQMNEEQLADSYNIICSVHQKLKEEFQAVGLLSFSMGVGEVYRTPESVRASFAEANEAVQYRLIFGRGRITFYFEICDRDEEYFYPEVQINKMSNYLEAGDREGAEKTLREIIAQIRRANTIRYDNIVYVFYQLLGSVINYILANSIPLAEIFNNSSQLFKEITERETLEDIQTWFMEILDRTFSQVTLNREMKEKYFSRIAAVVADNYQNGELDINYVAEKVGLSYSHLRKKFKEYFHSGFSDYINELRVQSAKELLVTTSLSIDEITEQVGFNNYQSLSRSFKKLEGVTPGKYREIHKK